MPLEIDPDWEYYVPDPDLDLPDYRDEGIRSIIDRREEKLGIVGFRFGRGNPDRGTGSHVGPLRQGARCQPEEIPPRNCPTCGVVFRPYRSSQKHCSGTCYHRPGRRRELPDSRPCLTCGTAFRPGESSQRYCSRACGSRASQGKGIDQSKVSQAVSLYTAGLPLAEIASRLGVSVPTVKRWRRMAGASPRRRSRT